MISLFFRSVSIPSRGDFTDWDCSKPSCQYVIVNKQLHGSADCVHLLPVTVCDRLRSKWCVFSEFLITGDINNQKSNQSWKTAHFDSCMALH